MSSNSVTPKASRRTRVTASLFPCGIMKSSRFASNLSRSLHRQTRGFAYAACCCGERDHARKAAGRNRQDGRTLTLRNDREVRRRRRRENRDRKSTRLNSSHLGISYAVFCLKKKNT